MKSKLACADFTFPLLPHNHVLDLIAMLGFDGVDIGLFEKRSHLRPPDALKAPARSGAQLGRRLADRGLECADAFLIMGTDFASYAINQPDTSRRRRARDWFQRTLDFANAAAARHVTALPGTYFATEKPADSWRRSCDELA